MTTQAPITLQQILDKYREISHTQRDSGTLFEDLMIVYFKAVSG